MAPHKTGVGMRALSLLIGFLVFGTGFQPGTANSQDSAGRFVFADLLTDRPDEARAFYGRLFGWRFDRRSETEEAILADGQEIGFLIAIENLNAAAPESQWVTVLTVEDVDSAVATANAAGGATETGPDEDGQGGRYAVLRDPQGALLTAYDGPVPAAAAPVPRRWSWFDLITRDPRDATEFYLALAGLGVARIPGADPDLHRVFGRDGEARAGLIVIDSEDLDPAWIPYIGVVDLPVTLARAKALGGYPIATSDDAVILVDPSGAAIGLERLTERRAMQ